MRKPQFDELEKLLSEAQLIPVYMDSVDRLERIVKEARTWQENVSKLLKVNIDLSNLPYVCDLVEWSERGKKLPLTFHLMPEVENKIRLANDWIARCASTFLYIDTHYHHHHHQQQQAPIENESSNLMNVQLIQILTPRVLDLHTQLKKLHNFLKSHGAQVAALLSHQDSLSSPENKSASGGASGTTRRARTKHILNTSLVSSLSSTYLAYQSSATDPLLELTGCADLAKFYSHYRLFPELAGKYNVLALRELEMIKHLRRLNTDRIGLFRAYLQNLVDQQQHIQKQQQQQQLQQQQAAEVLAAATSENDVVKEIPAVSEVTTTNSTSTNVQQTKSSASVNVAPFPFKCCGCNKSILQAVSISQFSQCQLCSGLFHCKSENLIFLIKNKKSIF